MIFENIAKEQLIKELIVCKKEIEKLRNKEEKGSFEKEFNASEERFRIALQHSPIIIAHVDKELRYTWLYNPHSAFSVDLSIGKRDDEISLNEGTLALMRLKKQVLDSGVRARKEIDFPIDGETFTYDVTAEPLRNETGQVIGLTTASTDITERKQNEKKLKILNKQLKSYIEKNDELMFELRRFRHNALNVLHGLYGFIEKEDWNGLVKYYNQILEKVEILKDNNAFSIERIKSFAVRGLLTVKLNKARQYGISMEIQVEHEIDLKENLIKDADLCELLGIYLDNAIEAAAEASIKKLSVFMMESSQYISIFIENTFKEKPDLNKINQGVSEKGKDRGLGLKISERILKKYPQVLHNIYVQHNSFVQEIHIIKQIEIEK